MGDEDLCKLLDQIDNLGLFPETVANCKEWLISSPQWVIDSVQELVSARNIDELNNRFYKNLEFGTGGMRSRTISEFLTAAEKGKDISPWETPKHASAGSAYLNDFNIVRATIALFKYCSQYSQQNSNSNKSLSLIISHDTRHFSEHFGKITAKTWRYLGGSVLQYDGPRSTPQLSFSVRLYNAIAGVMITASHNPAHDNGYKVYFSDGGQVVDPHATGIINFFQETKFQEAASVLKEISEQNISWKFLDSSADKTYISEVISNVLDPNIFQKQPISVVFTPIHGTGDIISIPALQELGVRTYPVNSQMSHDPRFPTVKSPNPENFEIFEQAIKTADKYQSNLVIGTDPDGDRVAIGIRNHQGIFEKFSGNITGALLAEFRLTKMKELGILPSEGTLRAVLIKTFVTSPLFEKIAKFHGIKCVNTLTGFKWIGKKLNNYETILQKRLSELDQVIDYSHTPAHIRRQLLLTYSTFFVFGGEESYGCLVSNNVRDKDANAAVVIISEMAATLKSQNKTLIDFRDEIYTKYGYYNEDQLNLYFEGASGAKKIKQLLDSYKNNPLKEIAGFQVIKSTDFSQKPVIDEEGEEIPLQEFFILELENGFRCAIRGSGTEPKIKFYIFGHDPKFIATETPEAVGQTMAKIKIFLEADAHNRI